MGEGQPSGLLFHPGSEYRHPEAGPLQNGVYGNQPEGGDALLLDASGSSLNAALFFVCRNQPVLLYTGEGSFLYLTGYDQTHVRVYHPESGATEVLSMETANQVLGAAGYDFICCVPTYRFRSLRKNFTFFPDML